LINWIKSEEESMLKKVDEIYQDIIQSIEESKQSRLSLKNTITSKRQQLQEPVNTFSNIDTFIFSSDLNINATCIEFKIRGYIEDFKRECQDFKKISNDPQPNTLPSLPNFYYDHSILRSTFRQDLCLASRRQQQMTVIPVQYEAQASTVNREKKEMKEEEEEPSAFQNPKKTIGSSNRFLNNPIWPDGTSSLSRTKLIEHSLNVYIFILPCLYCYYKLDFSMQFQEKESR